jgi:predicted aspartyl protease
MQVYRALVVLWCSILTAGDVGQLQKLADGNRGFELRRALQQPGWNSAETLFYRAVVASRFGREAAGIELLQEVLRTNPSRSVARKTHEEIAFAFQRIGSYRQAAQEWDQALLLTPNDDSERAENDNTRILMASLSDVAATTVELGEGVPIKAAHNRIGSLDVPVQVNGVHGQWVFDTGANFSTLIESEAKRMGLSVFETKAYVAGATEKKNNLRLAVARDMQFGTAHVHNVVFLVLADEALNIGPLHHQIIGILGLPVLRALGRVEISKKGLVRIHPHEAVSGGTPNLFFDQASPIVEINHGQHRLQMFLDTGANASVLYPSFRDVLTREETQKLKTKREKAAGAGGMIQRNTELVPALLIQVFETSVNLRKLSLLPEMPAGSNRYRDGVIGMDALWSGFLLDFDAMRLEVE